ncbi:MAG: hypothetical protein HQK77_03540 [Desulfobacterales bacterium]|nr:hypothetical protein [Desulfobacterales bacterium]
MKKLYYVNLIELIVICIIGIVLVLIDIYVSTGWSKIIDKHQSEIQQLTTGEHVRIQNELLSYEKMIAVEEAKWEKELQHIFSGTERDLAKFTMMDIAEDWCTLLKKNKFGIIEEEEDASFEITAKPKRAIGRKNVYYLVPFITTMKATYYELTHFLEAWPQHATKRWRMQEIRIERKEDMLPYHLISIEMEKLAWLELGN